MKLGILGTGKIVQEFLPWLVEHTPFTVQAVCSTPRSAAKAAELCAQYQIPQHTTNYFELLQWVDVVYIAVPNLQHARYARVALEAGKHVLCEKPLALSREEVEELFLLAAERGCVLLEALKTAFFPAFQQLIGVAESGVIGSIKAVDAAFTKLIEDDSSREFDPMQAGGAWTELGAYPVFVIGKLLAVDGDAFVDVFQMGRGV